MDQFASGLRQCSFPALTESLLLVMPALRVPCTARVPRTAHDAQKSTNGYFEPCFKQVA